MDRDQLIILGDLAVRSALANMCAILNGENEILTKIGKDGSKMAFCPRLECDGERSAILFKDENKAREAIDDILIPQDDVHEYRIFKFGPLGFEMDMDTDGSDEMFDDSFDSGIDDIDGMESFDDIDFDENDIDTAITDADNDGDMDLRDYLISIKAERFGDATKKDEKNIDATDEDMNSDQLPEDMTLDDAIKHAREVGEKMLSEDPECGCGKEHIKLANWLEELKQLKEDNVKDTSDVENKEDEENDTEESDVPSLKDMKRILKRNGYQLVSQKGGKEKWKKEDGSKAITLPKDGEIDAKKWLKIVDSNGLKTDI